TARIGFIAASLGAGRLAVNDRINPVAGIELKAKIGDKISRGEPLAVLFAADRTRLRRAVTEYVDAITISETRPTQKRLVIRRIADAKET
ncbi:MAG: hypothetical protein KAT58_10700, partial [candidate division Zixibacteria bacterium]|nr:hypothetical protein [candidate division Zixibacteria bacterium]